jgi:hypothetical protein
LNPFKALSTEELEKIVSRVLPQEMPDDIFPDNESISNMVAAATAAPSTGNDQPWKWYYKNGTLFLFHDEFRSYSFGDFQKTASFITFGAAYENLYIHALSIGIEPYYSFFPDKSTEKLVAAIRFKKLNPNPLSDLLKPLDKAIFKRHTNRIIAPKAEISGDIYSRLAILAESVPGAKVRFITEENDIRGMARIIGACDRMRLLHPEGHYDFVHREMRWTPEDAEKTLTGIDIRTLELGNSLMAAMGVIKSEKVIDAVKEFGGGNALGMLAMRTLSTASALCMISIPGYDLKNFFEGGRSMERFWLEATNLNLAIHPVISPLYLFSRILHGNGEGLDEKNIKELQYLRETFNKITNSGNNDSEVFLTKIAIAKEPLLKAHRLPLTEILNFGE